ncbi:MAG: MotA/TolQ/ExbB proton channel family protein [Candidatus Omnitrophica bacterium]|nr:MotA/TolQ/ExbB proton channel family protein [Candidatus Omnitrophota bacterium]MBU2473810.1 MotA/TolQ/ExbB proton channel family protein [Candidatus Omnitrophota bacterium]
MWGLMTKIGSFGWLMVPIFLCSIFSLAIILERLFFFLSVRVNVLEVVSGVLALVRKGKITEAIDICEKTPFYVTNILKSGLTHYQDAKDVIRESMENASLYEIPKLEKGLNFLSTISHVSPLLGLLGTVIGLVQCFYVIEQKTSSVGMVNPSDLANGIWIALLTTVAGLFVAIPSYIMYNYFVHKVNSATLEAERAATELLEILPQSRYSDEV